MSIILNIFGILLVFGAILFLAYSTTKFLGTKAGKLMKGKNLSVVESINLGIDKQIYLIKAGEKYILVSSAGKNIGFLTDIKPEDLGEIIIESSENKDVFEFKNIFDKYFDIITNKIKGNHPPKREYNNEITQKTGRNLERIKSINNKLKITQDTFGDDYTYDYKKDKDTKKE